MPPPRPAWSRSPRSSDRPAARSTSKQAPRNHVTITALTIAGSDPSGGAGLQADLRAFAKAGVNGSAVITAVTVQTPDAVRDITTISPETVAAQIDAAYAGAPIESVKNGMLANAGIVRAVTASLMRHGARNVVVDPVLVSSSGTR